ncbi:MAG: UvrD-helicase domain-containing protein [Chromatiales bacterium]|nr:UvrD-helicase domain-containing protein [Chromatiales bacterium]
MKLNPAQRAAVEHAGTPLLVVAGAGSGKTRVITAKIAHLIRNTALEAQHIIALTFTNKAAREMRERVSRTLPAGQRQRLRISTFHALGMRVLRTEQEALGLRDGFAIYDAEDQRNLLRKLVVAGCDEARAAALAAAMSNYKNARAAGESATNDSPQTAEAAALYDDYQRALRTCNAVDFDDLICEPIALFDRDPQCLLAWRERIRYLLVDEYQDTNAAQYELVRRLVGDRNGLTVVGDDDQSIYAWRGARPDNLLRLADDFPTLRTIKLEQNYRSTNCILGAANALIANNTRATDKRLWSELGHGDPIRVMVADDDDDEAERVVADLQYRCFTESLRPGAFAILYRGNHQARAFERALRAKGVRYRLSGGQSFFERAEVRDFMAYLRLVANPDDDNAFLRIVNTPRRGIGTASLEALTRVAGSRGASLYDAALAPEFAIAAGARAQEALRDFTRWLDGLRERSEHAPARQIAREMLNESGYADWLHATVRDPAQADRRLANLDELIDWLAEAPVDSDGADGFAERVRSLLLAGALERDDEPEQQQDTVQLCTLHAAKGLEFEHVYLVGFEEGLLPHQRSIELDDIEEERRLAYVGITRARRGLTLTHARARRRQGGRSACEPSRFLDELPRETLKFLDAPGTEEERADAAAAGIAGLRALLARGGR